MMGKAFQHTIKTLAARKQQQTAREAGLQQSGPTASWVAREKQRQQERAAAQKQQQQQQAKGNDHER